MDAQLSQYATSALIGGAVKAACWVGAKVRDWHERNERNRAVAAIRNRRANRTSRRRLLNRERRTTTLRAA